MNHCTFTGYVLQDPVLTRKDGGPSLCNFKLVVYNYVRNKQGHKKRYATTLTFEAWAEGAETIARLAQKGTKMTVYCTAKNGAVKTDQDDDVRFRVNEFDISCSDNEEGK